MEVGEIASQIYISRSFQVYIYIYIYCIYFFHRACQKSHSLGGELQPSAYKGDIYLKKLRFDSEILQKNNYLTLSFATKGEKIQIILPETNNSHLKIDGWNTIVSFWRPAYFPGLC